MKKRYKLKKKHKNTLFILLGLFIVVLGGYLINKMNKEFISQCMSNGYSRYYCEIHK